jgi:Xaa-Pro aminopeptidase
METDHPTRIERLYKLKKSEGLDILLLTSPPTIKWLTGYFYNFEIGTSPFQFLPSALVDFSPKKKIMIVADNEDIKLNQITSNISIKYYSSYVFNDPLDFTNQFLIKLYEIFEENNLNNVRIGIEENSLPFTIYKSLKTRYPSLVFVDVTDEIKYLKAIKDPDEIEAIKKSITLCDLGQKYILEHTKVGMTELEIFGLMRAELESFAGNRVPIMLDLVSGSRTEGGGGNPSNNIIKKNDCVLCDLTPCFDGYWGDTCNTFIIGKPTKDQYTHFKLVQNALQTAIDFIKPGIKSKEVDQLMRKFLSPIGVYNHHSGHGIGTTYHEEPRITPYNEMIIKEDMIIALEPAVYINGYGIRLEHVVLVTKTGCEQLSKFNHIFEF